MRAAASLRSTTPAGIAAVRSRKAIFTARAWSVRWHGWEYDFTTGASIDDPATRVGCFAVKVEGDEILVEIEGQALDTDQNALNDKC